MAKYIKQELPDLRKTGEKKAYYRLKTERKIDIYEQLMLNYDVFAKYVYDSLCFATYEDEGQRMMGLGQ